MHVNNWSSPGKSKLYQMSTPTRLWHQDGLDRANKQPKMFSSESLKFFDYLPVSNLCNKRSEGSWCHAALNNLEAEAIAGDYLKEINKSKRSIWLSLSTKKPNNIKRTFFYQASRRTLALNMHEERIFLQTFLCWLKLLDYLYPLTK